MSNKIEFITLDQLSRIMPNAKFSRIQAAHGYINSALLEFEISTPQRIAAFIAQVAHESGELKYYEEIASGADYEGRKDLGNTQPGDGVRFKGRGPIQLTGRANYQSVGKALGVDLMTDPTRASDLDVAWRIAGYYWKSRHLNDLADNYAFETITKRINGGLNHYTQRCIYYNRALKAFGIEVSK